MYSNKMGDIKQYQDKQKIRNEKHGNERKG